MLQQDSDRKSDRKFTTSAALDTSIAQTNDPEEGARLVRAFLKVADPSVRLAIVHMIEQMASELSA